MKERDNKIPNFKFLWKYKPPWAKGIPLYPISNLVEFGVFFCLIGEFLLSESEGFCYHYFRIASHYVTIWQMLIFLLSPTSQNWQNKPMVGLIMLGNLELIYIVYLKIFCLSVGKNPILGSPIVCLLGKYPQKHSQGDWKSWY